MTVLEEVIMFTFQQSVYYLTKVRVACRKQDAAGLWKQPPCSVFQMEKSDFSSGTEADSEQGDASTALRQRTRAGSPTGRPVRLRKRNLTRLTSHQNSWNSYFVFHTISWKRSFSIVKNCPGNDVLWFCKPHSGASLQVAWCLQAVDRLQTLRLSEEGSRKRILREAPCAAASLSLSHERCLCSHWYSAPGGVSVVGRWGRWGEVEGGAAAPSRRVDGVNAALPPAERKRPRAE